MAENAEGTVNVKPRLCGMVVWSCPWCNKSKTEIMASAQLRRLACVCGCSGPWMETERKAVLAWNKLAERIALSRRPNIPRGNLFQERDVAANSCHAQEAGTKND